MKVHQKLVVYGRYIELHGKLHLDVVKPEDHGHLRHRDAAENAVLLSHDCGNSWNVESW